MQQHNAVASGLITQVVPFCHFIRMAQRIGEGLYNYSPSFLLSYPPPPLVTQIQSGPEENDWRCPFLFIFFLFLVLSIQGSYCIIEICFRLLFCSRVD